ncbi:hypothetical protein GUA87_03455 [Sneathiella sp. P13V-1]|uniref:hypothetical protein n=1 Tax=Sneathiella sp. P13V-1 TaxID=2697366 RepID=UPI00187B4B3D|nr:hypothetical protein [Sneathiella sp. P13V-1]MBE7635885.1 hypothetical protein [Sneathiella sp. P13V-1]
MSNKESEDYGIKLYAALAIAAISIGVVAWLSSIWPNLSTNERLIAALLPPLIGISISCLLEFFLKAPQVAAIAALISTALTIGSVYVLNAYFNLPTSNSSQFLLVMAVMFFALHYHSRILLFFATIFVIYLFNSLIKDFYGLANPNLYFSDVDLLVPFTLFTIVSSIKRTDPHSYLPVLFYAAFIYIAAYLLPLSVLRDASFLKIDNQAPNHVYFFTALVFGFVSLIISIMRDWFVNVCVSIGFLIFLLVIKFLAEFFTTIPIHFSLLILGFFFLTVFETIRRNRAKLSGKH